MFLLVMSMCESNPLCLCCLGALSNLACCGPEVGVTSEEKGFNPQKLMRLRVPADLGLK